MSRLSSTSQSLGEAVGRASRYLPTLSLRRRGSGAGDAKPPPPPLPVWVQLLSDEQQLVEVPATASLEELQGECERATGVPAELQRLCVQGALLTCLCVCKVRCSAASCRCMRCPRRQLPLLLCWHTSLPNLSRPASLLRFLSLRRGAAAPSSFFSFFQTAGPQPAGRLLLLSGAGRAQPGAEGPGAGGLGAGERGAATGRAAGASRHRAGGCVGVWVGAE